MDPSARTRSEGDPPAAPGGSTAAEDIGEQAGGDAAAVEPSRRLEILCALIAVAGTGALVLLARAIEVRRETGGIDPRWWPELLGMTGLALAAVLLAVALVRPPFQRDDIEAATRQGWVRLVVAVALTTVFVALWPLVGFLVATPVFLCATTYLFGGRGWKALLIYPAALPVFVYLLFHTVLKVPL